jgi:hypothetical protein
MPSPWGEGGERSEPGEGLFTAGLGDPEKNTIEILHDISIGEPKHVVSGSIQKGVAAPVICHLPRMCVAIDFNHKAMLFAQKIDDIGTERHLSFELQAIQPMRTQPPPKPRFRGRHFGSKRLGALQLNAHAWGYALAGRIFCSPSPCPSPCPSPGASRHPLPRERGRMHQPYPCGEGVLIRVRTAYTPDSRAGCRCDQRCAWRRARPPR